MNVLERIDQFFVNRSKNAVLVLALAFALLIGIIDYFATPDLLIFYLMPIFFAAWYGGRRVGAVISVYCAGAGFVMETLLTDYIDFDLIKFYTFVGRLVMFLVLARIIATLQESRRQQRELTGFIVHDLRSPISSAISGMMTLEQASHNLTEEDREMVTLALVSSQRALSLVNSLLDVDKLESGKMEIRHETISIQRLVQDAVTQVALWARANEVEIETDVRVETATVDPFLTMRILVNLLSNALKFSPKGATVRVRVDSSGKEGVRFSVQDQGPGIPAEYVDRIFERFTQVKGTRSGTGLGLAFCNLAVHAQDGRIWVDSHVGRGTTMNFILPHAHAHATEPKPALEKA